MNVLLTGASGFVGGGLVGRLVRTPDIDVVAAVRRGRITTADVPTVQVEGLDADTDWGRALEGVDVVIHAAAMAHVTPRSSESFIDELRRVNVTGAVNLARQAARAGVRRFVFISSVKVNGSRTTANRPFRADDVPAPEDAYGASKREAEEELRAVAAREDMELVIVRPPLVYGPGVGANFLRLLTWIDRGVPLPLRGVDNRRSLLYLGNLADFVVRCAVHPAATGETFIVSDGEGLSTEDLVRRLAKQMARRPRLIRVPSSLVGWLSYLPGGEELQARLFSSLEVDSGHARIRVGWEPPFTVDEGLAETVRWYRERHDPQRPGTSRSVNL